MRAIGYGPGRPPPDRLSELQARRLRIDAGAVLCVRNGLPAGLVHELRRFCHTEADPPDLVGPQRNRFIQERPQCQEISDLDADLVCDLVAGDLWGLLLILVVLVAG